MYCINCGVKLAESEKKCPLCNTVVYHPDFKQSTQQKLYPSEKMPKNNTGLKALNGALIILFLVPLLVTFISDFQANGKIDWFGYVAGALAVAYVILALPLWFKKPNPVIFVPCGFLASALFLMYVNFVVHGDWYLSFALPVIGGLCIITCAVVSLICYIKRGLLYILGGAFVAFGGFMLLMEYLLCITFSEKFIGWSFYPLVVLVLLGGLLIYLAINRAAREILERKLFF